MHQPECANQIGSIEAGVPVLTGGLRLLRTRCRSQARNGSSFSLSASQNSALTFSQSDTAKSRRLAPAAQRNLIAIFQETPRFAARQFERLGAAPGNFQQAPAVFLCW